MKSKYRALLRRAASRGLEVTLTYEEFYALKNSNCYYCGIPSYLIRFYCELMEINTPWMTIDRKNNNLGYLGKSSGGNENCCAACYLCNALKRDILTAEEMKEIGKKYIFPKLQKYQKEAWDMFENHLDHLD